MDNRPVNPRPWYFRYWPIYLILPVGLLCLISMFGEPLNGSHVSPKAKCASNLRQIGLGIEMYAEDNNGQYPDSLETLILNVDIGPRAMVCPDSNDTPASDATTQAMVADLSRTGHISYIYLGKGRTKSTVSDADLIAYEPLSDHQGDGMNMLFGDGHVDWFTAGEAATQITKATSRAATRRTE